MKRMMGTVLVCALLLGCVSVLCACKEKEKENVPEGYSAFKNEAISFAYPSEFTVTEGDTAMLMADNGNNITVVFEDKNDEYAKMTTETYISDLVPFLEKAGLTVNNVKVEQTKTNGLDVTHISYNIQTESGTPMSQTQYIVTVREKTYTVTVTEVVKDDRLSQNVFETLCQVT